jgi:membrane protease YdiL (CAAX protease family)
MASDLPMESSEPPVNAGEPAALSPDQEVGAVVKPRYWGPWATLGWTVVCVLVMLATQILATVLYLIPLILRNQPIHPEELSTQGNLIALAAVLSTVPAVGLVCLLVWVRGVPLRLYLGLHWPGNRQVLAGFGGAVLLLVASDAITYLSGRPISPPVMVQVYETGWLPAIYVAFVVAAPLSEEFVFRGFFFPGIVASRWGAPAAVLISAVIWAAIHVQYDLFGVALIFVSGLFLGAVRVWTGSTLLTIALHAFANLVATLEIAVQLSWR